MPHTDKIQLEVEINGKKAGATYKELIQNSRDLKRELLELTPGTDKFIKKSKELKTVNSKLREIRDSTRAVSKGMSVLKAGVLGVVGAFSIQRGIQFFMDSMFAIVGISAKFEKAMSGVAAVSNYTAEEFGALKAKAKDLGATTSKSATEAAEGLKYLALAGFDAKSSMEAIEPVLRLSEAGNIDLATASDLATDSMSALGLGASDLAGFLDKATNASTRSNTSIEQLLQAFVTTGGTMKNLNVPLSEGTALLGVMANRGIKSAEAGNSLNSILINMTSGAGQAGKAMKAMNVNAFDSQGNFKGVGVILKELNGKFATMSQKQATVYKAMIAGKTQITGFNALLSGVSQEFDTLNESMDHSDGKLLKVAKTMQQNFAGKVTEAKSALQGLAIQIGEKILPFLTKMVGGFITFIKVLSSIPSFIRENKTALKLLVTGLILFNSQMILAAANSLRLAAAEKARIAITKGIAIAQNILNAAMTANPIGLLIKGVGVLITVFGLLYKRSALVREIVGKLQDAFAKLPNVLNGVKAVFLAVFTNMKLSVEKFVNSVKIGMLKAQKFLTISKEKRDQLQREIDELRQLNKNAEAAGVSVGEAWKEGFNKALAKAGDDVSVSGKGSNVPKIDSIPDFGGNVSDTGAGQGGSSEKSVRTQQATGGLPSLDTPEVQESNQTRLSRTEEQLDRELDAAEKGFLLKLFSEEQFRIKSLQAEADYWNKKMAFLKEQGKENTKEYRNAELEKLRAQEQISKERIDVLKREQKLKEEINNAARSLAKDSLQFAVEYLSRDEKARKKNAATIKALQIGKVTVDGIREIQGIFSGYSNLGPVGQAIAVGKATFASLRTGFAISKIASTKFAKGGFTGNGMFRDETGHRVAGVVHQDEYVAPTHQIKRYPRLFNWLNNERLQGFYMGGFTSKSTTPSASLMQDIAPAQHANNDIMAGIHQLLTNLNNGMDVRANVVYSDFENKQSEISQLRSLSSF